MSEQRLTVKEYALMKRVTERTVRQWIRERKIDAEREGNRGHWRIRVSGYSVPRVERPSRRGVYFLACGEFVKIGKATDVCLRYSAIQIATPFEIVPLGWIPANDDAHMTAIERELHASFAEYRHRGEWFFYHESLRAFLSDHAEAWPASRAA